MKHIHFKRLSFLLCFLFFVSPFFTFPLSEKYQILITRLKQNIQCTFQRRMFAPFIQVFFPPQDKLRPLLCALIQEETEQIDIEAFQLTDKEIAKSILQAFESGVKVTIIADISALGRYSKVVNLYNAGIPVYIYPKEDASSQRYALMHNKIMVLHSLSCIITGSMNFTKSGLESNQENLLIIQNKDVFKEYTHQFEWLKNQATPLGRMAKKN